MAVLETEYLNVNLKGFKGSRRDNKLGGSFIYSLMIKGKHNFESCH